MDMNSYKQAKYIREKIDHMRVTITRLEKMKKKK